MTVKVKGRGRSQRREDYWRRMVTRQPGSGLSIRAWCEQQGVKEASFYAWRRTLADRDANREAPVKEPPARLVALDVAGSAHPSVGAAPLQLLMADLRIEVSPGFDDATLRRVVRVLREAAAC
jgi:transposase